MLVRIATTATACCVMMQNISASYERYMLAISSMDSIAGKDGMKIRTSRGANLHSHAETFLNAL
jgi:hypothetical protein